MYFKGIQTGYGSVSEWIQRRAVVTVSRVIYWSRDQQNTKLDLLHLYSFFRFNMEQNSGPQLKHSSLNGINAPLSAAFFVGNFINCKAPLALAQNGCRLSWEQWHHTSPKDTPQNPTTLCRVVYIMYTCSFTFQLTTLASFFQHNKYSRSWTTGSTSFMKKPLQKAKSQNYQDNTSVLALG